MTDPILPEPMSAWYDESLALAEALNAQTKECYYNAIIGLISWTEGVPDDQKFYVEGVALDNFGIPMEHGWIKLGDKIIDPTWVLIYDAERMETVKYFPAIQYSPEDIRGALKRVTQIKDGLHLPIFMYPPGERRIDFCNPHIARAMEAAYRHSFGDKMVDELARMVDSGRIVPIS